MCKEWLTGWADLINLPVDSLMASDWVILEIITLIAYIMYWEGYCMLQDSMC